MRTALLVLLLSVVGMGELSAQSLHYDFEQCNVGDKVAETYGEPWTTWNLTPGSNEDAAVSDEYCHGSRSMKIDNGNDVVLRLGDKTTDVYHISLDMYIPDGKEAYFNLLHVFEESQKVHAVQAYFKTERYGTMFETPGNSFEVPYDEWFNVGMTVNLIDGLINMEINGVLVGAYLYKGGYDGNHTYEYKCLAAMNFFPPSSNSDRNGFFVDNILFEKVEGPYVHDVVFENDQIDVVLPENECDTVLTKIVNSGNVIDQAFGPWIEYGIGQDVGQTETLHYDSDPYYHYGYYNNNPYIEVGVNFSMGYLLDSLKVVGMKITKMQYFLSQYAANGLEGPMTFKVYDWMGSNGNVLAEKMLDEYVFGAWNTVEFDEPVPLRGQPIFATVGFQQANGGYPISLDAGPSRQSTADLVRLNGQSWFSLNSNSISYEGVDYGNHNIRLICEGQPVETNWVRTVFLSSDYVPFNILNPGQSMNVRIAFNTSGMDCGEYEAVLRAKTQGAAPQELSIPIRLKVSGTDINEFSARKTAIYPNPASDCIHFEEETARYATIYNSVGQMMKVVEIKGGSINVSGLSDGVYFLCIINDKGDKSMHKIVIRK